MIKLIVTTSGYVESSHMASLFWRLHGPWRGKTDSTHALSPKNVLHSLANELANMYRHEYFGYRMGSPNIFIPENFQGWLRDLTADTANDFGGELEHWWQWDTYADIFNANFKPKEVLLVEEKFDVLAAACVLPDNTFSADEMESLVEYVEENPFKVTQGEDKFWRTETIYTHLDDDLSECANKLDKKYLKEHHLKKILK